MPRQSLHALFCCSWPDETRRYSAEEAVGKDESPLLLLVNNVCTALGKAFAGAEGATRVCAGKIEQGLLQSG